MKYDKDLLQAEINKLIGKRLENVFYFTEREEYTALNQLEGELIEVPLLGILFEMSTSNFVNLISYDYYPYYGLGGIRVFQDETIVEVNERPNHALEKTWERFIGNKVKMAEIFESSYVKSKNVIVVPFGIRLTFENNYNILVINSSIESFVPEKNVYELCRGGEELVIFFDHQAVERHQVILNNTFEI